MRGRAMVGWLCAAPDDLRTRRRLEKWGEAWLGVRLIVAAEEEVGQCQQRRAVCSGARLTRYVATASDDFGVRSRLTT
jgi:hypothetical protein